MLYIRNKGDAKKALSPAEHLAFIKQCEVYIGELKVNDNLIAAQPLIREGVMISKNDDDWDIVVINPDQEVQVGSYHLKADSLVEAIELAKQNPEFAFVPSASIEVRPIKMKEQQTGFVYPKEGK